MKKEKYYQPSLEEFGINFEFEYQNKQGRWVKMKMDRLDFRVEQTMTLQYSLSLHKERFRVKYLGGEDIESLGFESKNMDGYNSFTKGYIRICNLIDSEPTYLNILKRKNSNYIGESTHKLIFSGEIKNKSELIKIIKMIGL